MTDTVAAAQLRAFFERWQRLEEEKKALSDDLKEMFAEAKGTGFDTKAMRAVFRDMMADSAEREEEEAIYDLYWGALNGSAHPAHHAREIIQQIPPSPASVSPSGDAQKGGDGANVGGGHVSEPSIEPVHFDQTEKAGAPVAVTPAPSDDFEPPAFLRQDKPLRPHCRTPDDCAGYGKTHCHVCLNQAEELAA